jgi:hypothetical protein
MAEGHIIIQESHTGDPPASSIGVYAPLDEPCQLAYTLQKNYGRRWVSWDYLA